MFLGILIKMNWKDIGQHNEPHFHAYYAEYEAVFNLHGQLLVGTFPRKQHSYVTAWTYLHEDELAANWRLAVNGEETFRIEPLR